MAGNTIERVGKFVDKVDQLSEGRFGEVSFGREAIDLAEENFISEEAAKKRILGQRIDQLDGFIKKGAVNREIKPGKAGQKAKEKKGDVLFYNSLAAERAREAIFGSLPQKGLKEIEENCAVAYKNVENIQADPSKKAEIMEVYEKEYIKYASSEKIKKEKLVKELEDHAEAAAKQLEVLRVLNERVKDKLIILEEQDSPENRDKKLQELIEEDPKFGADLFKIAEINYHLRQEETRMKRDMAFPMRFREVAKGAEEDLGRGCIFSLFSYVGKVFKIGWQSIFMKGKADEKVKHFFKEITKETFELIGQEAYYVGSFGAKAGQAVKGSVDKLANINRQTIGESIKKAETFRDETLKLLRKVYKGVINDRSMDPTN